MKESYKEDLANHFGLEPYAADGNIGGVASARGNAGQLLSSEIIHLACRSCPDREKATPPAPLFGEALTDAAESENLCMRGHSKRENREIPSAPVVDSSNAGRSANLSEGKADMNADGKSDDFVVPSTQANKAATAVAESVEERKSPKGSVVELPSMFRTLSRTQHQLERHDGHDR
jgi:hypothetical protein